MIECYGQKKARLQLENLRSTIHCAWLMDIQEDTSTGLSDLCISETASGQEPQIDLFSLHMACYEYLIDWSWSGAMVHSHCVIMMMMMMMV